MDEILNYKIFVALYQRIKGNEKAKLNRLFGRSLSNFLMKNPILKFKESVLNDAKEKFDDDEEKLVLCTFFHGSGRCRIDEKKLGEYTANWCGRNFENELRNTNSKKNNVRKKMSGA